MFVCRVLDPLVFGDYPKTMKKNAGSRIPSFTKLESKMVKGSFDFIGIIHYITNNVKDNPISLLTEHRDYSADQAVKLIGMSFTFITGKAKLDRSSCFFGIKRY